MKKFLALILALVMIVAVCASCGKVDNGGATKSDSESEAAREEIRNAISLLFDRNYIVNDISQGGEVPASSFVAMGLTDADGSEFYKNAGTAGFAGYYDVSADAYEANFNKAVETLKKYYTYDEETKKFTDFPAMTYLYNTSDNHKAIGEYLQSVLAGIGITMNLENQEWATFLNTRKQGDYSIARNGWLADYNDPISFLDMWTTGSGNNDVQFGKGDSADLKHYNLDLTKYGLETKVENGTWAETYDVLISTIKTCSDKTVRYQLMHVAEDMLMATGCICPLYFYTDLYMVDDAVDGFFSNPLGYKYFMYTTVDGKTDGINVCLASEPDTIDPALNSAVDGATLIAHLFSGLAKWAQDENGNLEIVADAATELPAGVPNDDGTITYTYTLRDGLKWSDGEDVKASDFVFAWNRAASAALAADYGYMFDVVKGYDEVSAVDDDGNPVNPDAKLAVEAVDDKTIKVTLLTDVAYWNELLAFPTYFPVREDVVSNENWATDPQTYISNGAYKLQSWSHDSLITLVKNDEYVDADEVKMETINFYLSDDANNMLANFKKGDWQLIDDVPNNEIASLKEEFPTEFKIAGQIGTYYVCWNINEDILPATK